MELFSSLLSLRVLVLFSPLVILHSGSFQTSSLASTFWRHRQVAAEPTRMLRWRRVAEIERPIYARATLRRKPHHTQAVVRKIPYVEHLFPFTMCKQCKALESAFSFNVGRHCSVMFMYATYEICKQTLQMNAWPLKVCKLIECPTCLEERMTNLYLSFALFLDFLYYSELQRQKKNDIHHSYIRADVRLSLIE